MDSADWALLIAIVSLVLAAASFGWQVYTWIRQAARTTIEAEWGALSKDMKHTAGAPGVHELTAAVAKLDSAEYPYLVIKLTVRNLGRLQMSILDVSVQFPSGATYRDRDRSLEEGLPWTLQPGEAKHVTIPRLHCSRPGTMVSPAGMHGVAQLGNGKSATSNSLKMLPP